MRAISCLGAVVFSAALLLADGWDVPKEEKERKNPIAADEASLKAGKTAYAQRCQMCHGEKGDGKGPAAGMFKDAKPGDLTKADDMGKLTDGELFYMITTGKKPMPAFKDTLKEEQRWHVVNYIRTFAKKK